MTKIFSHFVEGKFIIRENLSKTNAKKMNILVHYNQTAGNQRGNTLKPAYIHFDKQTNYIQGNSSSNHCLSIRITEGRRQQNSNMKVLKERKSQPRIVYLVKTPFKNESEIKTFSDKTKNQFCADFTIGKTEESSSFRLRGHDTRQKQRYVGRSEEYLNGNMK